MSERLGYCDICAIPNWAYEVFLLMPWLPRTDTFAELVDVLFECVGESWFLDNPIASIGDICDLYYLRRCLRHPACTY